MTEKLAFTVAEVVEATAISRSKIYEILAAGALRSVKLGGRRLILKRDLERWLCSLQEAEGQYYSYGAEDRAHEE